MHAYKKQLLLVLIILWSGFIAWEYYILGVSKDILEYSIRYDVIALSVLILFSLYAFYIFLGTENKEDNTDEMC
ncbi:hypothetical protein [Costertonia aggregata]|uniref:Uncharacterized protein n=1 Tax=Costertonia aggregata TaxID=343403 RepID=A0A7H9AL78_9FLAO|nr:hypothetical protein [Costertonia aggregata]QLG44208.1 hypothetical protein HYG79_02205 [Costertonia aggregata]